ncbi:MAG: GNAT family N-acetyltransferase [Bacillota bacterium]|nr:GNAT family N-acetyltransferase [Bacillota bacterium]
MDKEYIYRIAVEEDLKYTDEIEKQALPIIDPYYKNNIHIYKGEIDGDLIMVYDDSYPVGMGRYSFHPDGTMWLETVRVRPDYQGKHIGTGIYERYMEAAKENKVKIIRLYTEGFNEKSMGLTKKMGYKIIQKYDYYSIKAPEGQADSLGFEVEKDLDKIMDIMTKNPWTDMICINNVFYDVNRENMEWFMKRDMFYSKGDALLLVGARHNRDSVAYIGYMSGNYEECIEAAIKMNPGKTVSAGISKNNPDLGKYFSDFEKRYDLVVSEQII